MAVDISADAGTEVHFRIENRNQDVAQKVRYRYDCARSYVPRQVSTILVLVEDALGVEAQSDKAGQDTEEETLLRHYVFRYVHVVPDSSVTQKMSTTHWVSPGQPLEILLGTLSTASKKSLPPYDPPKGKSTWDLLCPNTDGKTDVAGHCSSGPHLHQAASNGNDPCLSIDIDGNCTTEGQLQLTTPGRASVVEKQGVTRTTRIFSGF